MAVYIDTLRLMDAMTDGEITRISISARNFARASATPTPWSIAAICMACC